jgi:hypothetical protein
MGHSSLAVSLTYLRGLEVSELEESDIPITMTKNSREYLRRCFFIFLIGFMGYLLN